MIRERCPTCRGVKADHETSVVCIDCSWGATGWVVIPRWAAEIALDAMTGCVVIPDSHDRTTAALRAALAAADHKEA